MRGRDGWRKPPGDASIQRPQRNTAHGPTLALARPRFPVAARRPAAGLPRRLVDAARQPRPARRRTVPARAQRTGDHRTRCARRRHRARRQRNRCRARPRLCARPGTLLRNGPVATRRRRRIVRAVRPHRDRTRQVRPRASAARTHPREHLRGRRRTHAGARGVHGRRQCRPACAAQPPLGLPAAAQRAGGLARGRHGARRLRDVLRPAGRVEFARTRAVEDPREPAPGPVRADRRRRHRMGRTDAGRTARQHRPACRRCRRSAQVADAQRRDRARHVGTGGARQQQFRGGRHAHRRWSRHRRRRHAPGPARAEPLVSRTPVVRRSESAGRPRRRFRLHPARHSCGDRRQQSPCRLGIHQQLRRLAGFLRSAVDRCRAHALSHARGRSRDRDEDRAHSRQGPGGDRVSGTGNPLGPDHAGTRFASQPRLELGGAPARCLEPRPVRSCPRRRRRPGVIAGRTHRHPRSEPGGRRQFRPNRLAPHRADAPACRRLRHAFPGGTGAKLRLAGLANGRPESAHRRSGQSPAVDGQCPRRRRRSVGDRRRCRLRQRRAREADPRRPVRETTFRRARFDGDPARRPRRVHDALVEAAAGAVAGRQGRELAADRSGHARMAGSGFAGFGELSHRPGLAPGRGQSHSRRLDGAGDGQPGQGFRDARPAADRGHGLAAGHAAAGAFAAASLRKLGRALPRCGARRRSRSRRERRSGATSLGRTQYRAYLPSGGTRPAEIRRALALHAARSAARRRQHAASARPRIRSIRTHGRCAGA